MGAKEEEEKKGRPKQTPALYLTIVSSPEKDRMSTCRLLRSRALLHQACLRLFIPGQLRLPRLLPPGNES